MLALPSAGNARNFSPFPGDYGINAKPIFLGLNHFTQPMLAPIIRLLYVEYGCRVICRDIFIYLLTQSQQIHEQSTFVITRVSLFSFIIAMLFFPPQLPCEFHSTSNFIRTLKALRTLLKAKTAYF